MGQFLRILSLIMSFLTIFLRTQSVNWKKWKEFAIPSQNKRKKESAKTAQNKRRKELMIAVIFKGQ
jgi:hypothetical protein